MITQSQSLLCVFHCPWYYFYFHHRNGNIFIKFSSLSAPKVVKIATFSAAIDENFIKMTTCTFPWCGILYSFPMFVCGGHHFWFIVCIVLQHNLVQGLPGLTHDLTILWHTHSPPQIINLKTHVLCHHLYGHKQPIYKTSVNSLWYTLHYYASLLSWKSPLEHAGPDNSHLHI